MTVQLTPRRVAAVILCGLALITLGQMLTLFAVYKLGEPGTGALLSVMGFRGERNLVTWYGSMLLLACAFLLGAIAAGVRRQAGGWLPWAGLAITFVGLSIDAVCGIHGLPSEPLDRLFEYPGPLQYSWVIPGVVFVIAFAGVFARFVRRLPARSRWSFIGAGALFVGGALGMEMILGIETKARGSSTLTFDLLLSAKKLMQLLGSTAFLYALLVHVRDHLPDLSVGTAGDRAIKHGRAGPPADRETQ